MNRYVANKLFVLFDRSIGIFLRTIYRVTVLPFLFSTHPSLQQILERKSIERSAEFVIAHMPIALVFRNRNEVWDYCLKKFDLTPGGTSPTHTSLILEFGVYKGYTINYFAKSAPTTRIIGFDSFEGLQEDWVGTKRPKGYFDLNGVLPRVAPNVELVRGWFEDSLPKWLLTSRKPGDVIRIIHIDSDTFDAALFVMKTILSVTSEETIFIFDEYLGYNGWEYGEHRAVEEISKMFGKRASYLAVANQCVALVFI